MWNVPWPSFWDSRHSFLLLFMVLSLTALWANFAYILRYLCYYRLLFIFNHKHVKCSSTCLNITVISLPNFMRQPVLFALLTPFHLILPTVLRDRCYPHFIKERVLWSQITQPKSHSRIEIMTVLAATCAFIYCHWNVCFCRWSDWGSMR